MQLENQATLGSITTTDAQKRKYAAASLAANCANPIFRKLFPDLVELHETREREQALLRQLSPAGGDGAASAGSGASVAASALGMTDKGAVDSLATVLCAVCGLVAVAAVVLYCVV
jgi:ubiquitin-conjugating enzyme E2 J2